MFVFEEISQDLVYLLTTVFGQDSRPVDKENTLKPKV